MSPCMNGSGQTFATSIRRCVHAAGLAELTIHGVEARNSNETPGIDRRPPVPSGRLAHKGCPSLLGGSLHGQTCFNPVSSVQAFPLREVARLEKANPIVYRSTRFLPCQIEAKQNLFRGVVRTKRWLGAQDSPQRLSGPPLAHDTLNRNHVAPTRLHQEIAPSGQT